jgi:hypothetical protein
VTLPYQEMSASKNSVCCTTRGDSYPAGAAIAPSHAHLAAKLLFKLSPGGPKQLCETDATNCTFLHKAGDVQRNDCACKYTPSYYSQNVVGAQDATLVLANRHRGPTALTAFLVTDPVSGFVLRQFGT